MAGGWKKWEVGKSHLINRIQWGEEERKAIEGVLDSDWFANSKQNKEFEANFSKYTGIPYIHGTNSGSAAIQTGLMALKQQGYWRNNDLVIHPITTFATSISSSMFLGMTPVFVETKPHTYVADPEEVARAVKKYPRAKGMILPHLIGNIPNMDAIKSALDGRFLIEDCCDTLGGTFDGKHVGSFGDLAAFSFYASHHITAGGVGGAVGTSNKSLEFLLKSTIYWGRDFKDGDDEFLKRYNYATMGTDSQLSALQAAFANAQLAKLPGFVAARAKQFEEMTGILGNSGYFHLPEVDPKAKPSWFAYPITVKSKAPFTREELSRYLTGSKVEVRPLMCGNIMEQQPFRKMPSYSLNGKKNHPSRDIETRSLFIPCWGMSEEEKEHYYGVLTSFFSKYKKK